VIVVAVAVRQLKSANVVQVLGQGNLRGAVLNYDNAHSSSHALTLGKDCPGGARKKPAGSPSVL